MRWLNAATSNVINILPPVYLHASAAEPKRRFVVNQVSMHNPYYVNTAKIIILRLMNSSSMSYILSENDTGSYTLGNKGEDNCSSGTKITNNEQCRTACQALGLPFTWDGAGGINNNIANGVCLKSYDGTCKKRESNAGYAFLICNQGNVMDKISVLNIPWMYLYLYNLKLNFS